MRLYHDAVTAVADLEGSFNRAPTPEQIIQMEGDMLSNLTDSVYACRETYELLDNLRKRMNHIYKEFQKAACVAYMQITPDEQDKLSKAGCAVGDFASGKPSTKITVASVKRDKSPELYDRFCREVLGVKNEALIESGAIEVHYKYFGEWVTEQVASGGVLPDVMKDIKTYQEFEFRVTKHKAILAGEF